VALTVVAPVAPVAKLYVPAALNRGLERYGSLGSVFTVLSWLIALCVIVSVGITAGAVIAREPAAARRPGSPD
jgi:membrane protein